MLVLIIFHYLFDPSVQLGRVETDHFKQGWVKRNPTSASPSLLYSVFLLMKKVPFSLFAEYAAGSMSGAP